MDIKHIHCMLEDMATYGKEMVSCMVGDGDVNLQDLGEIIDIVKDLAEAEYHALIAKEMRKAHEEEEEEEKYMLRMLKDEHKDEYKHYMDEYGEDGERRFYDNYRYANGRFAPKGRGTYRPRGGRRGYEEMIPMDYRMTPEDFMKYPPEYWRDMDRLTKGIMYYTEPARVSGAKHDDMTQNNDRYVDGYDDGTRKGYEDGYRDGEKAGKTKGGTSKYDKAKRGYEETKEMHKDNSPESKQKRMKELEAYMNELNEDMKELISDMSPEERAMVKQKVAKLAAIV